MGLLKGDWGGHHKIYGKFYRVMCKGAAYILCLSENIIRVTCAMTKGFNVISEKDISIIKKNATTLKFEI